ncbi:MAG TPA: Dam family site-specific DNA-(adenine-N6)-methyltransferase [Burkholderiaceae bacterium]|nr:Dam family site-specific DNA-(adenine-N6)-methyltransferase [Burkholderiaceae bacterium]
MKPFLKWAGGKFRIIDRVLDSLPKGKRLIEPFVGSGSVFLNANFEENVLADSNADLIHLYKQIQADGKEFIEYANSLFVSSNNTEVEFYKLRDEFNTTSDIKRKSALFVYLNRHCFNGLCRYNSKGKFNVPFGRYTKPNFPKDEMVNFFHKSESATFQIADYKKTMESATLGSVVYCDPPYAPIIATSNFTSYTQDGFNLIDQQVLADYAKKLIRRGVPVIISNHDTEFTRSLYSDAQIETFDVQRFISRDARNRNKAAELIAVYA